MARDKIGRKAEIHLGRALEKFRRSKDVSRKQLAQKIRVTERQIEKYEAGAFVPMPVLEAIAEALDSPIPKRLVRRISNTRKLEIETEIEQEDLIPLYDEALSGTAEE